LEERKANILAENIKVNSLGKKQHPIYLDDVKFSFANTEIYLSQISDLKFGLSLMQFYRFSLGSKYVISVKDSDHEINLVFINYFGLDTDYFDTLYDQITDAIWDQIADRLVAEKVQQLKSGNNFKVGNCLFNKEGITINRHNLFSNNKEFIPWEDLTYKKNYNRLTLYSKSNSQIWTNLFYTENWNVYLAMYMLDWIYDQNGLTALKLNNNKFN